MLKQLKYSARLSLHQRFWGFAAVIVLNLVFLLLGSLDVYGTGWKITAVVLSSLAFCALFVVSVIADYQAYKSLFSPPEGYSVFLTPVPRWKILLGRLLPMVVLDLVSLVVGVAGIVIQSLILSGLFPWRLDWDGADPGAVAWLIIVTLLYYIMFLLILFFVVALNKSVLYRARAKTLLGIAAVCVIAYVFSVVDLVLAPLCQVTRYGDWFFTINLVVGWNPATIAYLALMVIKIAALFTGTTYLMERKINI